MAARRLLADDVGALWSEDIHISESIPTTEEIGWLADTVRLVGANAVCCDVAWCNRALEWHDIGVATVTSLEDVLEHKDVVLCLARPLTDDWLEKLVRLLVHPWAGVVFLSERIYMFTEVPVYTFLRNLGWLSVRRGVAPTASESDISLNHDDLRDAASRLLGSKRIARRVQELLVKTSHAARYDAVDPLEFVAWGAVAPAMDALSLASRLRENGAAAMLWRGRATVSASITTILSTAHAVSPECAAALKKELDAVPEALSITETLQALAYTPAHELTNAQRHLRWPALITKNPSKRSKLIDAFIAERRRAGNLWPACCRGCYGFCRGSNGSCTGDYCVQSRKQQGFGDAGSDAGSASSEDVDAPRPADRRRVGAL